MAGAADLRPAARLGGVRLVDGADIGDAMERELLRVGRPYWLGLGLGLERGSPG